MNTCPECGHTIIITRAMKGRMRKGTIDKQCVKCGCWCRLGEEDADIRILASRRATATEKLIAERKYYGLCLSCGEPTKNSARYCDKCRKKK